MNIYKALEHFEWKLKNHWKPTKKDIEAYNAIIDFKELQETKNLSENELFAKMWIHQLILLSRCNMYDGKRCLEVLDEILSKSVYHWCEMLKEEMWLMKYNSIGNDKYPINSQDEYNLTELHKRKDKIIKEYSEQLKEALVTEITIDEVISFVKKQITLAIDKYEKC